MKLILVDVGSLVFLIIITYLGGISVGYLLRMVIESERNRRLPHD